MTDRQPRAVRLAGDRSGADVVRAFAGDRCLVCLRGNWAGGSSVIASEPVTVHSVAADPLAPLRGVPLDAAPARPGRSLGPRYIGGGWFGVLDYPTGRRLQGLPDRPAAPPRSWLAFYDHLLRWDGVERAWWFEALWSPERDSVLAERLELLADRLSAPVRRHGYRAAPLRVAGQAEHLQAVERCISHIRAGDIFQANVATVLDSDFHGSTVDLFADGWDRLRPAYGAYVDTGDRVLVGFSPELFLSRRGRTVVTSPIKGTRPRAGTGAAREARVLRRSAKDAAENVMIVDLMRNDLGRVCVPGTVAAPRLLEIQPHPGVWHLVSTVTGELGTDVTDADLLAATFPPGSVTGAPKRRAMQIIDACEAGPRRDFTGAVGFTSPVYGAEFAVTIRSFEVSGQRIALWVGGGITVDSVPIEEWRECLTKARPLLVAAGLRQGGPPEAASGDIASGDIASGDSAPEDRASGDRASGDRAPGPVVAELPESAAGLLETVLVSHARAVCLADHLARLDRSCRELYGRPLPDDLAATVVAAVGSNRSGRLRIVARPVAGALDVAVALARLRGPTGISALASMPRPAGVWRHKYADRRWLAAAEESLGQGLLPLFVDGAGLVAETSRGNLFVVDGESVLTPPLTDTVLPGVTRRRVIDAAFDLGIPVRIEPVPASLVHASGGMFTTSAISGLTHIDQLDGKPLPAAGAVERALSAALAARG